MADRPLSCRMVAEVVGSELQNDRYVSVLLPPLIARWSAVSDSDEIAMPPLMECLVFVTSAINNRIAPCAPQIYKR